MRRLSFGLAVVLATAVSCGDAQVAMVGPHRPARPLGCEVQLVPGTPSVPVLDLASARVKCIARGDCLDELHRQTCAAGGDVVYGLTESDDQHITYMAATLALRAPARTDTSGQKDTGAAAPTCTPICSPGFDCQGGRCIPLCNPACDAAEICNVHRICEPAPSSAPAAVPPA